MELNKEIKARIDSSTLVNKKSAFAYLLAVYFKCSNASCFSEKLKAEVHSLNIFTVDNLGVTWLLPLFNGQEANFEWVREFRDKFKTANKSRAGDLKACIARMKEFFSQNPHIRKEQVLQAVDNYLATVNDPNYLCTSHYFIVKGKGLDRVSLLEIHLEEIIESQNATNFDTVGVNRMMD